MSKKLSKLPVYIFLTIASLVSIFPFFWMVVSMTNKSVDILKGKTSFGFNLVQNFVNLNNGVNLKQVVFNSSFVAIITTIFALLLSSMAGYALVIYHSNVKERVFKILLFTMMVPFAALMIPLFKIFSNAGLANSYAALILPSVATAFLIFFFRQNTKSFPKELIQAARVDGVSEIRVFFQIYMPTMKSTYAAAAIITFMASWNNYFWPLIIINTSDMKTFPLIIASLADTSAYNPDFGVAMVAIVLATIPTILLFFLMQKYFVEGIVGSTK